MNELPEVDQPAPTIPHSWRRALLPTAILVCLERADLHGYAIAQALDERGLGAPRGGSLYPVLARLEKDGAVSATWTPSESGPGRRTYTLTPAGRQLLSEDRESLGALAAVLGATGTGDSMRGASTETEDGGVATHSPAAPASVSGGSRL